MYAQEIVFKGEIRYRIKSKKQVSISATSGILVLSRDSGIDYEVPRPDWNVPA
jgi:hypothetical protein